MKLYTDILSRLRGRPAETEWPRNVTLPWSSFRAFTPMSVSSYLPEMDPVAVDLFDVIFSLTYLIQAF